MRRLVSLALVVSPAFLPAQSAPARLRAVLRAEWEWELRSNPTLATSVGDARYDDRLEHVSPDALRAQADSARAYLARVEAVDRRGLSRTDRVSQAMLARRLRLQLDAIANGEERVPLLADEGFHTGVADLPAHAPHATVPEVERYLARLAQVPRYFRENVANMRRGARDGFTLPRVVLEGYETSITTHLVATPDSSVFFAPLRDLPASMPAAERERLRAAARRVIADSVIPAYRAFGDFMRDEYVPRARATIAARDLPGGEAYYRSQVRRYTTLDLSPDSIHAIGLAEVARIRAEMDAAMRRTGWTGSFADFLQFLRTDPRFYPKSGEELLMRASYIAKRMDGELPKLFRTLPRQPYGVEPVPAHLAPKYTTGRYSGAAPGGTAAPHYWVNLYDLPSRKLYTLEALTLHESVPGHHLQIALAQELTDLPAFRRSEYNSAFGEGWGLYAERLGLEAGFYTDPYSDFGRLTYEMWRACRLVVDTGIHWKGWTRQQAMDYLAANTALPLLEVRTETDRYIAWPGQALAYKLGELTIRRLRAESEAALGSRFDVRAFHDVVLRNGAVPLPVLEDEVHQWLADARR